MELPVVEVDLLTRLSAPKAGDALVTASVGPAGEAVAVWAAPDDAPALRPRDSGPGGVSFAGTRALWPVRARVTVHDPGLVSVTTVPRLRLPHLQVQPLPGGAVLLVGSRCQWRADGPDCNAAVYGPDGKKLAEAVLGDGIGHVMTDTSGHVWVGYFDEGIAGSKGWGGPGPEPVGSCGLARYSPQLRTVWRYQGQAGPIADCYALNVDGDAAWACYYTGFPVLHVDGGAVESWRNDVVGASAVAVAGPRVALYGGYGANSDRLAVGVLRGGQFQVTAEYRLALPGGGPVPSYAQVTGRGPALHFFVGADWYQLTITDIPLDPQ